MLFLCRAHEYWVQEYHLYVTVQYIKSARCKLLLEDRCNHLRAAIAALPMKRHVRNAYSVMYTHNIMDLGLYFGVYLHRIAYDQKLDFNLKNMCLLTYIDPIERPIPFVRPMNTVHICYTRYFYEIFVINTSTAPVTYAWKRAVGANALAEIFPKPALKYQKHCATSMIHWVQHQQGGTFFK